jgi:1,4-dihydroxy-2-naphthoate octaprenyltransferase
MQVKKGNMQWKYWIEAARLRTLPLSLSGIITGTFLAAKHGRFSWQIVLLAFLTTVGFQVLSNFANDYGDGVKGTDNAERIGPKRALQSGNIQPQQMLWGISITALVTFVLALVLIYTSFGDGKFYHSILFLLLGIASILAAIKYTMGKKCLWLQWVWRSFCFFVLWSFGRFGKCFLTSKKLLRP